MIICFVYITYTNITNQISKFEGIGNLFSHFFHGAYQIQASSKKNDTLHSRTFSH